MKLFSFALSMKRNAIVYANNKEEAEKMIMNFDHYDKEDILYMGETDLPTKPDIIHLF